MKSIMEKKFKKEEIHNIYKKTIKSLALYKAKDWPKENWWSEKGKIHYSDWSGSEMHVSISKERCYFQGVTCGGTAFSIDIDLKDQTISLLHDGARRSDGPWWNTFLPDEFWKEKTGWELVEYKTSRPDWAPVNAVCPQHFPGIHTLAEEESRACQRLADTYRSICKKINKHVPEETFIPWDGDNIEDFGRSLSKKLKFNALDYRRAAAMGINLTDIKPEWEEQYTN